MKKLTILFVLLFCGVNFNNLWTQKSELAWDNNVNKNWPAGFTLAEIRSSIDGAIQKAWLYKTSLKDPQPLIVSLHTWSGDYNQEDPLAKEVKLRDWNYIHPDFRGRNNKPEACGSDMVIADIEDAIAYAIHTGNADPLNVHIVGVSGGGYATLLAYMKLKYPVKSFNAWAPISDLTNWYWESKSRKNKYANDLEEVAKENGRINWDVLKKRSPINLPAPGHRINVALNIYAGIHDGYTGSVPVTHSILFYNKLAVALFSEEKEKIISDSAIVSLLTKRTNPEAGTLLRLNNRIVHLQKKIAGLSITIFEGSHEMLIPSALVLPPIDENKNTATLKILTIGDSNGAFDIGWPMQMMKLLPYSTIINKSVAGNTIGFDNLDQPKLNTLKNIRQYLNDAYSKLPMGIDLDYIFIGLGTNDTKAIFKDRQKEVIKNLHILIQEIFVYLKDQGKKNPHICIITPSPMDDYKVDKEKYSGSDERIQKNNSDFKRIANENNIGFLDSYSKLKENFSEKTNDGVHLNEKAQFELATYILSYINEKQ